MPSHDVEIDDAVIAPRALADSRLAAMMRFHQRGYAGRKAKLVVRDGASVLASRDVTLGPDGNVQTETLLFNVGAAGAKALQFSIDAAAGRGEHRQQRGDAPGQRRLGQAPRALHRGRAALGVQVHPPGGRRRPHGAARLDAAHDREQDLPPGHPGSQGAGRGFPDSRAESLFAYQALIIGSVEASYFTPAQRELIREFVDRRGGGLLLLGGRFSLADGGWGVSNLADLLPVVLPDAKGHVSRRPRDGRARSRPASTTTSRGWSTIRPRTPQRWKKLPYLMDYQDPGTPKPGATVLAEHGSRRPEDAAARSPRTSGAAARRCWPRRARGAGR